MARGILLSDFEKGQIVAYKDSGISNAAIGRLLSRSRACITLYLQRAANPPLMILKRGRPLKLTPRSLRQVRRTIRVSKVVSCSQLIARHRLRVSKPTLIRALKRANLRWRRMKKMPLWKPRHIEARLEFARVHMTWDAQWRKVIFSDEKKFNLDGPDGYKSYWHGLGDKYKHYSKRVGGGRSIMMWCAFGYGGKFNLHVLRGRVNAIGYQEMLEQVDLVENGELIAGEGFVFQQDNAPPHSVRYILFIKSIYSIFYKAHSTQNWLRERNIDVMKWPALSPDLNPVENIWAMLARQVYGNGTQFECIENLEESIHSAWNEISLNFMSDLIESMKCRIYNVIRYQGKHSGY